MAARLELRLTVSNQPAAPAFPGCSWFAVVMRRQPDRPDRRFRSLPVAVSNVAENLLIPSRNSISSDTGRIALHASAIGTCAPWTAARHPARSGRSAPAADPRVTMAANNALFLKAFQQRVRVPESRSSVRPRSPTV